MRLIDADALKASFPKANADIFQNCRNCTCMDNEEIDTIIDSAPTVYGWVSVTDRMPDKSGPYLVMLGNMFVEYLTKNVYFWDAKIGYWRGVKAHSMIIGITHWMPLPPGPEVREDCEEDDE